MGISPGDSIPVLIPLLIGLGFLVGTYGTLIGIGGGVVLVPVLMLLYPQASPEALTSISLAIVFVNALSGALAYARQRRIDYRNGLFFALATLPGTVLGVWTLRFVPQQVFSLIFGILLILFSIFIWLRPQLEIAPVTASGNRRMLIDRLGKTFVYTCNRPLGIAYSFVAGFLAGLLGIGGGIIHVPVMAYLLGFPAHIATATSHFILVFTALAGSLTHAASGTYAASWPIMLWIALGVIPGAQLGAWLSPRIHSVLIVRLLVLALVLAGMRLIISAI